jgi:hypothetical protein
MIEAGAELNCIRYFLQFPGKVIRIQLKAHKNGAGDYGKNVIESFALIKVMVKANFSYGVISSFPNHISGRTIYDSHRNFFINSH